MLKTDSNLVLDVYIVLNAVIEPSKYEPLSPRNKILNIFKNNKKKNF